MVIISDYSLVLKEEFVFFVESSVTTHMCPICQATLSYRDSRPRIRKKEGGVKEQLIIRRFHCKNCHSYHNELPDCLVPYKHYETEVISVGRLVQKKDIRFFQKKLSQKNLRSLSAA